MKIFFLGFLLFTSVVSFAQDSAYVQPKRYVKLGINLGLRLEAEWKQSEWKSKNLALNMYFGANYYNGFKLLASKRRYIGKKHRWFGAYQVGLGYVEKEVLYWCSETITYKGSPDLIYETFEKRYQTYQWFTAGIGAGVGYQRTLGKKKRWLFEGSAGIQYYYYRYKKARTETETLPDGGIAVRTKYTFELTELWESTPWENNTKLYQIINSGAPGPFSILYGSFSIGHNF